MVGVPRRALGFRYAGFQQVSHQLLFFQLLPFTFHAAANVLAVACSLRLADTVKGGELRYMALAMECEPIAYRSLLMLVEAVLGGP